MGLNEFIYQQDNDPKHTSKVVKEYLELNKVELLEWPSKSPDLNPIEHIWAYMKKKIRGKTFKNKDELKACLKQIWNNISKEFVEKLIFSMPKRVIEELKTNGKHTRYYRAFHFYIPMFSFLYTHDFNFIYS